jgi:hypothetical protein
MFTGLGALVSLVVYGFVVACVGLYFLTQERLERLRREDELKLKGLRHELARLLLESQHAKLTIDSGEELDVFLQPTTGR